MWTGFSNEEIQKLHSSLEKSKQKDEIDPAVDGSFKFKEPLVLFPNEPTQLKQFPENKKTPAVILPKSQAQKKLLNPTVTCSRSLIQDAEDKPEVTSLSENNVSLSGISELNEENVSLAQHDQKGFLTKTDESSVVKERCTLEQFHERQKLMEEQNKRKKELLIKAIADRKRRTQSEAQKIVQIQDELNRLDSLLSTDVSILRDQIEVASLEFNDAQKRFDRIENEFIQAKIHLFSKLERKELLTEHLCRIIEVNEQRKAKKLSELMSKLEISDEKSLLNCSETDALQFPQITSLNEVTRAASASPYRLPTKVHSTENLSSP